MRLQKLYVFVKCPSEKEDFEASDEAKQADVIYITYL